ncbi:DUF6670 family protein [Acinetobacter haemolyticus]|uniref:AttH domain-containing protein n=1 Tax=Acinetobacter haemolyticus TaxID=29430 RepID=A0A4P7B6X3_ACIHA|nr:DUF6670 family protein [Acinetobacter haemolyticus]QBQ16803.1 hypothetical protein AHTJR_11190 [Acinetobacter haemolyticus]
MMPKQIQSDIPVTITGRMLPNSRKTNHGLKDHAIGLLTKGVGRIMGVARPNQNIPYPNPDFYQAINNPFPFKGTHFGIMIADAYVDPKDGPLNTAVLVHGTALANKNAFSSYSIQHDMQFDPQHNLIRFGENAEIFGQYPHFRLISRREDFAVDLKLTATGANSWFAHSAIYQHMSLLMNYEGEITYQDQTQKVSGLATWEHWKAPSLAYPLNKTIPKWLKIPADFFTYQVLTIDATTQLLLGYVTILDHSVAAFAMLRQADGTAVHLDADVHFEVLSLQAEAAQGQDGSLMSLPETFRWQVIDKHKNLLFDIYATVDTPMLFGLATGYVGGYHWHGSRSGVATQGRGYIEYIDRRD